jgi:hypothetical protein
VKSFPDDKVDKEKLVDRLVDWLENPQASSKKVGDAVHVAPV